MRHGCGSHVQDIRSARWSDLQQVGKLTRMCTRNEKGHGWVASQGQEFDAAKPDPKANAVSCPNVSRSDASAWERLKIDRKLLRMVVY